MNLIFIIFLTIVFLAFVGMFYWMYKTRNGIINLNKNSWHFKLVNWMWEAETSEIRNVCPYYWSLVLSVLILIPYSILRYLYVFYKYIYSLFPEKKKKEIKINPPKKIEIKKAPYKYSYIYSKSKNILEWIVIGTPTLILLIILIRGVFQLYVESFTLFISIICILIYLGITLFLHDKKPNLDIYHWNHYRDFFSGLFGIIKIPFVIINWILSNIFYKLTNVYKNNCPGIEWEEDILNF